MSQLITPVITLNSTGNNSNDYFSHRYNVSTDGTLVEYSGHQSLDNAPSISHKKPRMQLEPLSMQFLKQDTHNEPLLLSPYSILQNTGHNNSSPAITKRIVFPDDGKDQRPSVVTFSCDKESSIFYDTVSAFDDDHENKLWQKRPSIATTIASKRSFKSWKKRCPSVQSAYTQRTTNISILHHQIDQQHLQQGIILCATVSAKQKQFDSQPKYNHQQDCRKRPLKWREYRAVMTCSGYLELYRLCHCSHHESNLLHIGLHQRNLYYKKPCHVIDLHPTLNQQKKSSLSRTKDVFFLSLMSPVDFSWSLSSANTVFYFQTASARQSQQWYQALYASLPVRCKKPTPKVVDLNIPQLNMCIRLPLEELIQVGDENVDLRRVRDSALVLLDRHGNRPVDWSKQTVGLCWRYKEQLDWIVKPWLNEEQEITYLVEPRLIEETHELELRYWDNKDSKEIQQEQSCIEGPLIDTSSNKKGSTLYYGATEDHFLFLYTLAKEEEIQDQQLFCFKFLFSKKRYQTFPSDGSPKSLSAIIGVIDLLQIKHISYEKDILHLDQAYSFQTMHHPSHGWSTRLEAIQKHYQQGQVHDDHREIKQSGILYMKSAMGRYSTFEQRLCILTKRGDFYIFKSDSDKNKTRKALDFCLSLTQKDIYVYSGQECCSYVSGLPIELPSRLFDSGMIVERNQDKPSQRCFIVYNKSNQYIFFTRTQDQKETWVRSIFSINSIK